MFQRSLVSEGRILKFIQFDTMRRVRATFTKTWQPSPVGKEESMLFHAGRARGRTTTCPMESDWFALFLKGAEERMGFKSEADKAVKIGVVLWALKLVEETADNATQEEAFLWWKVRAMLTILQTGLLRGPEGFYANLGGIRRHLDKGRGGVVPSKPFSKETNVENVPHVVLCLARKFKGETGHRYHMLALASKTVLGIKTWWWIEKLVKVQEQWGNVARPAFCDQDGGLDSAREYNDVFHLLLEKIHRELGSLIPPEHDVCKLYSFYRTPQKTAE